MEGERGKGREEIDSINSEDYGGVGMLFGSGLIVAAGTTIGIALLDKACEELGFNWLGSAIKLLLPIVGFALAIYFLETNTLLRWLR